MKSWTDLSIRKRLPRYFFRLSGSVPRGMILMWLGFAGMQYDIPLSMGIVIIGAIAIIGRFVDACLKPTEHSLLTKDAALNDIARSLAQLVELQRKSAALSQQLSKAIKRARELAEEQINNESPIDKIIRESQRQKRDDDKDENSNQG